MFLNLKVASRTQGGPAAYDCIVNTRQISALFRAGADTVKIHLMDGQILIAQMDYDQLLDVIASFGQLIDITRLVPE